MNQLLILLLLVILALPVGARGLLGMQWGANKAEVRAAEIAGENGASETLRSIFEPR